MERAFFHPSMGAWVAIDDPSPETMASYPEGTQEISLPPAPGWGWDGTEWTPPAPEPEAQPEDITVSRMQARMALYQAGLLSEVQAIVAQGDPLMQMAWAEAVEWKRSSPMINGLAQQLGLSAAQVDALFLTASQIEV